MWKLDHKEGWVLKNWYFWTVVLEKTLENPLDCTEIKPVDPKGNQSWIFIGRIDAKAEAPILWLPDAMNRLTRKDPDAGKDWGQAHSLRWYGRSDRIHRQQCWESQSVSRSVMSDSLQAYGPELTRLPCPSPSPWSLLKLMSFEWWCHPTILSSVIPFSSCLQSFLASGSFPKSQFFTSGGQSIGVSASASVLSMNIQDWIPFGWSGWISLQSKGLSKVLSNTTIQNHQFFGVQLSVQSNSNIHTWLLEKP